MKQDDLPALRGGREISREPALDRRLRRRVDFEDERIRVDHREMNVAVIERVTPLEIPGRAVQGQVKAVDEMLAVARVSHIVIAQRREERGAPVDRIVRQKPEGIVVPRLAVVVNVVPHREGEIGVGQVHPLRDRGGVGIGHRRRATAPAEVTVNHEPERLRGPRRRAKTALRQGDAAAADTIKNGGAGSEQRQRDDMLPDECAVRDGAARVVGVETVIDRAVGKRIGPPGDADLARQRHLQDRPAHEGDVGVKLGDKGEIGTVQGDVMPGKGEDVVPVHQHRGIDGDEFLFLRGVAAARGLVVARGLGGVDGVADDVAPGHLDAVEVGHKAVIIIDREGQVGHLGNIHHREGAADKHGAVAVLHVREGGGIVAVAIAKPTRRRAAPQPIVVGGHGPVERPLQRRGRHPLVKSPGASFADQLFAAGGKEEGRTGSGKR